MANIHTLNEINNGAPLVSGNKLGDSPFDRYPSSRTELENQRLKYDLDIALSSGIQLGTRNSLLMKNNESFSERVCQLEDEAKELKNEINQKEISLSSANSEIATKSEEIQALQSEIKELEMKYFLAQKDLSEMDSLRQELAQTRQNIGLKNVDLDLKEYELSEKKDELMQLRNELINKKEELMQMRDNLFSVQQTLSEKETLLQETNTHLAKQILKTSSESEVLGGVSGLEKGIEITSPKTTSDSPYYLFFQYAINFVIVLLIICILWCVFSRRNSSYNEEKNILNYKIPLNRNQSYGFPI